MAWDVKKKSMTLNSARKVMRQGPDGNITLNVIHRHPRTGHKSITTLPTLFMMSVLLIGTLVEAADCPQSCTCPSDEEVLCNDLGLTQIPDAIMGTGSGVGGKVMTLDMSGNELNQLSVSSLVSAAGVVNLKLGSNQIENIEEGAFNIMMGLQTLDLSQNHLHNIHQGTFNGATSLLHLDLSANRLEHIDGAFVDMSHLTRLDLRNNKIKHLTQFTFRDLSNLRYLLLESNQISHTDKRSFRNLQKLSYVVLKNNPIGNLDNIEFSSNLLSYIDISECGLRYVPRGLPNSVRYLQLRRNNMTVIHKRDLSDVPYVMILVLDENGITFLEDGTFTPMIYLQQLWLNGNRLTAIPKPLPTSLQRLLMDSNQLGAITDLYPTGSQINTLSFMGNNISYISPYAFLRLPLLSSLDVSNNVIHSIYADTFTNNSQLKKLLLSMNPITYFYDRCFHGLQNLGILTLAYVDANATIHDNIFSRISKLRKLDLDSSPGIVWSIFNSKKLLSSLATVEELSMQSVELAQLRSDFPELFPRLSKLHISSTRWHCDMSLMWFRDWLKTTTVRVSKKDDIQCFTPRNLHGKPIIELEDTEFVTATTLQYSKTVKTFPPVSSPTPAPYYQEKQTQYPNPNFTPPNIPFLPTSFHEDLNNGRTHNPFDIDFYENSGFGNIDDQDPDGETIDDIINKELHNGDHDKHTGNQPNKKETTTRLLTWEEFWSQTSSPSQKVVATAEKKYDAEGMGNSNLEIFTVPKNPIQNNDGLHTQNPSYNSSKSDKDKDENSSKMLMVIIISTITGAIVLAVSIAIIILAKRKRRTPKEEYKNAIKYQHRNDVLYFMPHDPSQTNIEGVNVNVKEGVNIKNGDVLRSASSGERMALVPGRDINHEGPLRVYKWEDF